MAPKHEEKQRFEFVLYINKNRKIAEGKKPPIVCQRYFDIRDYNEDSLNSLEMKELMDKIMGMGSDTSVMGIIPSHLKGKSEELLWRQYKPWKNAESKDLYKKEDIVSLEIKVDGRTVAESQFVANVFHPQARYKIDIKNLTDCYGNKLDKDGNVTEDRDSHVSIDIIPRIMREIRDYMSRKRYTTSYGEKELKYEVAPYDFA